jgi:hypothetical protein
MDKGQRVREILSHLVGLELAIKGLTGIEEREREREREKADAH